jgi:hypothetical protein
MVVTRMMLSELDDYTVTTVKPANDHQAEVAELLADLDEIDLMADDGLERAAALKAQIKALQSAAPVPASVARVPVVGPDGEVMTIGDHFASKDAAGRRAYLAEHYAIAAHLPDGQIKLDLSRKD